MAQESALGRAIKFSSTVFPKGTIYHDGSDSPDLQKINVFIAFCLKEMGIQIQPGEPPKMPDDVMQVHVSSRCTYYEEDGVKKSRTDIGDPVKFDKPCDKKTCYSFMVLFETTALSNPKFVHTHLSIQVLTLARNVRAGADTLENAQPLEGINAAIEWGVDADVDLSVLIIRYYYCDADKNAYNCHSDMPAA